MQIIYANVSTNKWLVSAYALRCVCHVFAPSASLCLCSALEPPAPPPAEGQREPRDNKRSEGPSSSVHLDLWKEGRLSGLFRKRCPLQGGGQAPGGTGGPCVSCRQGLPEHLRRARLGTEARPRPAFLCGCSQQRLLPLASLAGLSGKLIGWPVTVAEEAAAIHSLPVARFPQRANGSSPPPPCPFPHTRPAAPQATAPLPARPLPRAALTCPAADLPGVPRARGGRPTVSDLPMGLHHSHPVLSWPLLSARNFVFCPPCPLPACSYHLPACWSIWWFPN